MIVSAIIGARKIFQRMTTYSKYTVAMTFRIAFTFGLLTVLYDWCVPRPRAQMFKNSLIPVFLPLESVVSVASERQCHYKAKPLCGAL